MQKLREMSGTSSFLDPSRVVESFALKTGDHVADFGAGHGYFTIPLARAVGREGKVWAIDIQDAALDIVRSKAREGHLLNIAYVHADLEVAGASGLAEQFADFVVIANILFQAEHKDAVLREAWRVLRKGGRLGMIEWDRAGLRDPQDMSAGSEAKTNGPAPAGPAYAMRVKKEEARAIAVQAGFELDREISAGPHHYGFLFVKR